MNLPALVRRNALDNLRLIDRRLRVAVRGDALATLRLIELRVRWERVLERRG